MSYKTGSKSSTLRSSKFDDEVDLKLVPTSTPVKTWKVVYSSTTKIGPLPKKNLISKGSPITKTSNRFYGIRDEFCDLNLDEVSNERRSNPEDDIIIMNKTRYKIKTKKTKRMKQKCVLDNLLKP